MMLTEINTMLWMLNTMSLLSRAQDRDCGILLANMRTLGLDTEQVDAVVISHVHGDHCGGLAGFLQKNHNVTVYLPRSLPVSMKRIVKESGAKLVEAHDPIRICRSVYSTGELGHGIREQSLVIETSKGLLLITGCAHPGIVDIVKRVKAQRKGNVHLALGGFHLCGMGQFQIGRIVEAMKRQGVESVAPSHCSGEAARSLFEKAYGRNFIRLGVGRRLRIGEVRKRPCLYLGAGAVRARDVADAFDKLGMAYTKVDVRGLSEPQLQACSVLVIPGGYTKQMADGLGPDGLKQIRQFVLAGGGYIGICAGAYIAADKVEVPGRPQGLGIIRIVNHRRSGKGMGTITAAKPDHPVWAGCKEGERIWHENGPAMEPAKGVDTLAVYSDGSAAVVCADYGKGRIVIFSPHPEGSIEAGIRPEKLGTLPLFRNAVGFASNAERDASKDRQRETH